MSTILCFLVALPPSGVAFSDPPRKADAVVRGLLTGVDRHDDPVNVGVGHFGGGFWGYFLEFGRPPYRGPSVAGFTRFPTENVVADAVPIHRRGLLLPPTLGAQHMTLIVVTC